MSATSRGLALAALLAGGGVYLAVDAWLAGSLLRYVLAGVALGATLTLPLVTLLLFGERARRCWRKAAFAMVPTLALLLLAEVAMRLLGPPHASPAVLRVDARLGHVLAPGTGGTDARGWRNPSSPESFDVLFVGDSQTWGFGVDDDETFPARFAERTGSACYQMATGSYGPVQYVELVRRGLRAGPSLVVVGLYFGNDLVDAVDYAALDGAEAVRSPGFEYHLRHNPEFDGERTPNAAMWLIDRALRLSQLLDLAANVVKARLRGGVLDHQDGAVAVADERVGTLLLPKYRRPALDLDSPHVQEGARVTARCLQQIAALCRAADAACVVLLIPTKEFTYAEWRGDALPELRDLRRAERAARERVFAAVADAGLIAVDLTGELVAALERGEMPWFSSGDGHLAARGHAIAAQALGRARGR